MRIKSNRGLTLIEIIISIAIIGIIAITFLTMFSGGYKYISNAGNKSISTYNAQDDIEKELGLQNSGNSETLYLTFNGAGLSDHDVAVKGATVSDSNNILTTFLADNQVVLVDTTPPIITLNGNQTINLNVGDNYFEPGASAIDDVDGDISSNILITGNETLLTNPTSLPEGSYVLAYNVSDSSGNSAIEKIRTVNVLPIVYYGNINGNVKEDKNPYKNISGVEVSVMNGITLVKRVYTDSSGNYSINDVPTGTYSIIFSKTNYTSKTLDNNVVGDGITITVDAMLNKK